MKTIQIIIPLLVAFAMSTFTACSDSNDEEQGTNSYIINMSENRDIPLDASMLALDEGTKIKITRDVESNTTMNVYVIRGSVEVTEGE